MEEWKQLEFEYAKRLRESPLHERRALYAEAYDRVSVLANARFESDEPEQRTAGTNLANVQAVARLADTTDDVLEVGCGRGYTCLKLAPHVRSIVGTDVSSPVIDEARALMEAHGVFNVAIEKVGAFDLSDRFGESAFSLAVSVDVLEHLHPEDAREHLEQVFRLLRPSGRYMIFMPSRLNGPHDITMEEFPSRKEPLGFHLNESTYGALSREMRRIGYRRFRSLVWTKRADESLARLVTVPLAGSLAVESAHRVLPRRARKPLERLLRIRLVAMKPRSRQGGTPRPRRP
jgi:SAM-dependent methyltransferase